MIDTGRFEFFRDLREAPRAGLASLRGRLALTLASGLLLAGGIFPAAGANAAPRPLAGAAAPGPQAGAAGARNDDMVLDAGSSQFFRQQAVEGHRKHDFSPRTPPRRGKFIYGHWTPYEPPDPSTYPPGSRTHVIVRGDTLWDISARYYKDNYLWPYIWDANSWITYPHWIYPGDTLLIPSLMIMPEGTLQETAQLPGILDGFRLAAGDTAYTCGHFVADPNIEWMGTIISTEADPSPVTVTTQDVVYIDIGAKDGALPGDEFAISYPRTHFATSASELNHGFGPDKDLRHPVTGDKLGTVIKMSGRLKIILLGEEVSTARITHACDSIEVGYSLFPFQEMPIPLVRLKDRETHFNEMAERGRGFVVWAEDQALSGVEGALITLDLGSRQGAMPGDVFTIYRTMNSTAYQSLDVEHLGSWWDYKWAVRKQHPRRELNERTIYGKQRPVPITPPRVVGRCVVLYTQANTATAMALESNTEFYAGDRIVYEAVDEGLAAVRVVRGGMIPGVPLSRQPAAGVPLGR